MVFLCSTVAVVLRASLSLLKVLLSTFIYWKVFLAYTNVRVTSPKVAWLNRFWCKVAGMSRTGIMARMTATKAELFKGRHFDQQVIILCVRWYLSYKLSARDLVDMMGERGIELAHTTILRWVQRYVPEFEKRWSRYAGSVGGSWRCDETYIKVKGQWT